jgi:hypothetical protein
MRHASRSYCYMLCGGICEDAMIVTSRYTLEQIEGSTAFRVRSLGALHCPDCGSFCSRYDTRSRRVIHDDGHVELYLLRRVYCSICNALHLVLPNFIYPHKHYAASVITDALAGHVESCPAEASTVWRWRQKNHPPGLQCLSDE